MKTSIHNQQVEITITQGELSPLGKNRLMGKLVAHCRDKINPELFIEAMDDFRRDPLHGGPASADLIAKLDDLLAEDYTPGYDDYYAPIANIKPV